MTFFKIITYICIAAIHSAAGCEYKEASTPVNEELVWGRKFTHALHTHTPHTHTHSDIFEKVLRGSSYKLHK